MPDINIRAEVEGDAAAVRRVHVAAFGRAEEADLVDALRRAADPYLSLVAEVEGAVVGHILFTPVEISGEASLAALSLAPMAVLPEHQRRGIGAALVREGLAACERLGYDAVFVLGHPDYYPRFGFEPASRHGFESEYGVPDEVFMVRVLKPAALTGRRGTVRYHPAFSEVE